MNIKPNVHNFVMIVGFAIIGLLIFQLMARNAFLAKAPIVGQVIRLGAGVTGR